jgi:hypothetical protein
MEVFAYSPQPFLGNCTWATVCLSKVSVSLDPSFDLADLLYRRVLAYAQAYGVIDGQSLPGTPADLSHLGNLPAAMLVAQTIKVLNPNGTVRKDALRVNGAAVKGDCSCASKPGGCTGE